MGTIRNGANGGFSGKAGSVIGSSWNNISYIKGLPKRSNKPASIKQLDQRARFAAALTFLGPIKDVLIMGYRGQTANRATGFNMGIQYALANAITGTYPSYAVDKALIKISKGTLQPPSSVVLDASVSESLKIDWAAQINMLNAFVDDTMVVLLYNEEQNFFLVFTENGTRGDAGTIFSIPADFAGQTVHTYLFYVNRDGTRQSNSVYVAPITIP